MDVLLESVRSAFSSDAPETSHLTLQSSLTSRPELFKDVVAFVHQLETGSVTCLSPIVSVTRALTEEALHLSFSESQLATIWCVVYHTSHSFEVSASLPSMPYGALLFSSAA